MSSAARRLAPAPLETIERVDVFLRPGQYFVGDHRHQIRTVLGSCVSITLWHPQHRVGAMSHFLLSHSSTRHASRLLDPRYGEGALRVMLRDLEQLRVPPAECVAKVFGGGSMFPAHTAGGMAIGKRNGEDARLMLEHHGLSIASESLFGEGHRQIVFDVATGDVWARQLKPVDAAVSMNRILS